MNKITLFGILWKKEKGHWVRLGEMLKKFPWYGKITLGLIFSIIITIAHYAFSLMSTLWESFLWIVARKQFKINIQRMALTVT